MDVPGKVKVGEFEIAMLSDGLWRNDGGCMFGVVPRELWQRDHPGDDRNRIRLNLTCPLIMRGGIAVLVDTGIGNRLSAVERKIFDHGEGWLLDGLKALGMEAGDVTHVVLSHLHFDHCGGIVRRRPSGALEAAFPRARVMVQQGELEIARASRNERLRAAYRHIEECLAPLGNSLEALDGDTELMPGLDLRVTGGHTVDHQIVQVRADDGGCFVHLADIVPTRSHMKGPWNQAYDLDALRTMEVKADYLRRAIAGGWWVSFAHDDQVLAAQVRNDRGRFALGESIPMPSSERTGG
ncbi:MAG TPA: MBL fold metallo-hydrolase [Candidatus Binataceae bacterium]|jgi:glyoxylase-like metal-dependent hydrolase (beta-lactamase superfamily II)|nr:MBL fold metallo-hydrolase [Candidatus Binataceae bacterium]